jgi:hypothetical protein
LHSTGGGRFLSRNGRWSTQSLAAGTGSLWTAASIQSFYTGPNTNQCIIHFFFTVDATVAEVLFLLGLLFMAPVGDDHCPISEALQSSEHHHRYMRYFANERCEVGKEVGFEPDALDREMLRRFFQVPLPCIILGY